MKKIKFECDDRYEAEKLAGLLSVQKDNSVYLAGVEAVIGNEVVIKLKDRSSHAVILKDQHNADRLRSLLQDIVTGRLSISSSEFQDSETEIVVG